ncbi:MAG: ATP-binding protein [Lachnospiraceae bacterium]|nr:ATP-binding protein [Lachnospiraceae bacterium]
MENHYWKCEDGQSQYDEYDLTDQNIVDARYIHARLAEDAGNRYIEALPLPREEQDVLRAYTKNFLEYRFEKVKNMSKLDRMLQIGMLRSIRFPLPFHKDLEFAFYNALLTSYRSRRQIKTNGESISYMSNNTPQESDSILTGSSGASTNAGFSLIGYSGCGKSSAIETLVSHYPQVIMHEDADGYFPQITYLVVNCIANSNFSALYQGVGDAIDKALGNMTPVYAKEIERIRGLGAKAERIRQYVERFAVGIIIFDEIQLIDFEHTKENSFDSLLTLANRTKVAIAVVGTEDAREKMFSELRTARRIGTMINGNLYCENKAFFSLLVRSLFRYQWFDKLVEPNEEIIDTLYDLTKGIVDQLVGIYSCMNYDYVERNKHEKINGSYIRKIANRYYPGIQKVLECMDMDNGEENIRIMKKNAELRVDALLDKARQEHEMDRLLASGEKAVEEQIALENIAANINAIFSEYSEKQIENAYEKIMKRKSSQGKTEKEITRLVLKMLEDEPKRRKDKNKITTPDISSMQSFLGINEEEKTE